MGIAGRILLMTIGFDNPLIPENPEYMIENNPINPNMRIKILKIKIAIHIGLFSNSASVKKGRVRSVPVALKKENV